LILKLFEETEYSVVLDMVYILLSKIWKRHLRYQDLSKNMLSKNIKVRAEQLLASVYVLYLYKLYWSYILDWNYGFYEVDNYWKITRHVVTNIRRVVIVLVNFQNKEI